MVTTLSDYSNYYIAGDVTLIDNYSSDKKPKIEQQASKLLQTLPKNDNHYKYIQQIAGQDNESKEKISNRENGKNETRSLGPSPRSARELLKSYEPDSLLGNYYNLSSRKNKPMSEPVLNFVESNLNQLKAIEDKSRNKGTLLSE